MGRDPREGEIEAGRGRAEGIRRRQVLTHRPAPLRRAPPPGRWVIASVRGTSGGGGWAGARAKLTAAARSRVLRACAGAGVRGRNQRAPRGKTTARTYQLREAGGAVRSPAAAVVLSRCSRSMLVRCIICFHFERN